MHTLIVYYIAHIAQILNTHFNNFSLSKEEANGMCAAFYTYIYIRNIIILHICIVIYIYVAKKCIHDLKIFINKISI